MGLAQFLGGIPLGAMGAMGPRDNSHNDAAGDFPPVGAHGEPYRTVPPGVPGSPPLNLGSNRWSFVTDFYRFFGLSWETSTIKNYHSEDSRGFLWRSNLKKNEVVVVNK